MTEYGFVVSVKTDTKEHAEQVIAERTGYDEDYGFPYTIEVLAIRTTTSQGHRSADASTAPELLASATEFTFGADWDRGEPGFQVVWRGPGKTDTCKHCGRRIVREDGDMWVDPNATGDDSIWRETCDAHDTFTAYHEPTGDLWAVMRHGYCYQANGMSEYEPSPSNRSEEFLARTRFSRDEAIKLALEQVAKLP